MTNDSESPPSPPFEPAPGDVLAGKYRVEQVIGVGGMGVVVAATHVQLEERVALKYMHQTVMNDDTVARFLREARAAAKIKSEHVARVIDVGTLEAGAPYMVMEYLVGQDLARVLRERGPLPVPDAVEHLLEACEAIAEAHALGMVHRDLKPANLFLAQRAGRRPMVKVLDFGISKVSAGGLSDSAGAAMTRTTTWLGSPRYMSPEQMRSARDVDARSDVWSLGLVLFELLTGHVPFEADTLPALCGQVLYEEPVPLERWLPDAPPDLGATIRRCLVKDRAQRCADVAELALALAPHAPPRARPIVERIGSILEAAGRLSSTPADRSPAPPAVAATGAALSVPPAVAPAPPPDAEAGGAGARRAGRPLAGAVAAAGVALLLAAGAVYVGARGKHRFTAAASVAHAEPSATAVVTAAPVVTPATAAPVVTATATADAASPPAAASSVVPAPIKTAAPRVGRPPVRPRPPANGAPPPAVAASPTPPAAPAIVVEECFQRMPDGTRTPVPCP